MMIFTLILIRTGHSIERITAELPALPSVHEMVSVGGTLFRVEDVTYNIESKEIEVRAVA